MERHRNFVARFEKPFLLSSADEEFAAGEYLIVQDEESIEGPSFTAFRRLATHIYISDRGMVQMLRIEPEELSLAELADADPASRESLA